MRFKDNQINGYKVQMKQSSHRDKMGFKGNQIKANESSNEEAKSLRLQLDP